MQLSGDPTLSPQLVAKIATHTVRPSRRPVLNPDNSIHMYENQLTRRLIRIYSLGWLFPRPCLFLALLLSYLTRLRYNPNLSQRNHNRHARLNFQSFSLILGITLIFIRLSRPLLFDLVGNQRVIRFCSLASTHLPRICSFAPAHVSRSFCPHAPAALSTHG